MKFEEKLARLEEIIAQLENDSLGLDNSVKLYQEAKKLSQELNLELAESMKKLSYIVEDGQLQVLDEENLKKDI